MNLKRLWLNIGMLLAICGLAVIFAQINGLINCRTTEAEMTGVAYYHTDDGEAEPHPLMSFIVDGQKYTREAAETFDMKYERGKKFTITYDIRDPGRFFSKYLYWEKLFVYGIPMLLLGAVLTVVNRKAFKGYKKEFLLRYKKSCIYTSVSLAVLMIYRIWYDHTYSSSYEIFGELRKHLLFYVLLMAVVISIAAVWTVAVMMFRRQNTDDQTN